ncbi:MAG: preprotein translocase subunit SecG [Planctomycetota bacterium]|jgi:preprotein translocase subunit SecG|nr:MAG: preprotein translocase subunit SecG [Planctomycetota bacterium]
MMAPTFAILEWFPPVLNILIWLVSVFLILLILIQKGKGGGLAGAFGGPGGQSAFGSKTADAFTKITLYVAGIWVALIVIMIWLVQPKIVVSSPTDISQISKEGMPAEGAPVDPTPKAEPESKETPKTESKDDKKEPVKEAPKVEPKGDAKDDKKEPVKDAPKVEPKGDAKDDKKAETKKN